MAGLKVGAEGDKIGFLGAAPVAKQASANQAEASDANSTQTLANELRDTMIKLGFWKGSAALIALLGLSMLMLMTVPAEASVQTDNVGMTNAVAASTTITTSLGSQVNVINADNVQLFLSFAGAGPDTGNVTVTLARSPTSVYWETTPKISVTVAANGTNTVRFATNLTSSVVGASGYLKVVSFQNAATNALTGVDLQIIQKRIR